MRLATILLSWLVLAALAGPAAAQPRSRPSDERELPEFEQQAPEGLLAPLPPAEEEGAPGGGPLVFVRACRVQGSSVFSEEELAGVTAPWTGRAIDSLELRDVANAITSLYVERGYASSGAYVPDQEIVDGVLTIQVVESVLTDVRVEGNRWYGSGYLRRRLRAAVGAPVNLHDVEAVLHLLLEERGIGRVFAELRPGLQRGETLLVLQVEEGLPLGVELRVANDRSPDIGSVAGESVFQLASPLRLGDQLRVELEFTEGFNEQDVDYEIPIGGHGTRVALLFRRAESEIVEEFEDLDIQSDTLSGGIELRHPVVWEPQQQLWLGLLGEWRRSDTELLGRGFSLEPGADEGEATVSVLRVISEWVQRSPSDVFAARSTLSFGLDLLGSTQHPGGLPDSDFVAWLGQAQWAHRFREDLRSAELVARMDLQLADSPLLSLERFAVGGLETVRGYRENQVVRDNAALGSLELRVPLLRDLIGRDVVSLAPFFDVGHAWDDDLRAEKTLAAVGLGLRYELRERLALEAYWGQRLNDRERFGHDLQDYGVHLQLTLRVL